MTANKMARNVAMRSMILLAASSRKSGCFFSRSEKISLSRCRFSNSSLFSDFGSKRGICCSLIVALAIDTHGEFFAAFLTIKYQLLQFGSHRFLMFTYSHSLSDTHTPLIKVGDMSLFAAHGKDMTRVIRIQER